MTMSLARRWNAAGTFNAVASKFRTRLVPPYEMGVAIPDILAVQQVIAW